MATKQQASQLQKAFGFRQRGNWKLYLALSIPWGLFCLMRLPMLFPSIFCGPRDKYRAFHAGPGECYWYTHSEATRYRTGILLHLCGVVPAGLLAIPQFTPRLRQRFPGLHRACGYASTAGVLWGNAGVLMLVDRAFGGELATQAVTAVLAAMTTGALIKGVAEARARRFPAHRAWMLRAWAYLGAILTMRPLMAVAAAAMSLLPSAEQWRVVACREAAFIAAEHGNASLLRHNWPVCDPAGPMYDAGAMVAVRASLLTQDPVARAAALRASFGPMAWVALLFHALAVEAYLNYTATGVQKGATMVTKSAPADEKRLLETSATTSSPVS